MALIRQRKEHANLAAKELKVQCTSYVSASTYKCIQQMHEIEKQIHFEKFKQESVVKKYHHVIYSFHVCFTLVQFCMFLLLNVGFLANFQEIIGNISGKILQGLSLVFGSVSIFSERNWKIPFQQNPETWEAKNFDWDAAQLNS